MESAHLSTGFISKLGAFLKAYTVIRPIRRLPQVPLPGGEHPNGEAEVGDPVGQDTRLDAPRAVPEQVVREPRHQPYQPLRVFGREETRRDQERDPRERPRRDRLEYPSPGLEMEMVSALSALSGRASEGGLNGGDSARRS